MGCIPGTKVKFVVEKDGTRLNGGQVRIIPLATPEEIKANAGVLGMKGKLLKSLMKGEEEGDGVVNTVAAFYYYSSFHEGRIV